MNNKKLKLNFLALKNQDFKFSVYCRLVEDESQQKDGDSSIHRFRLPYPIQERSDYRLHDIAFSENTNNGLKIRSVHCSDNVHLTQQFLLYRLLKECNEKSVNYIKSDKPISVNDVRIIISEESEGKEYLSIRPYRIPSINKYGYLLNHGFKCNEETNRYSKSILIKTLSYNKNGEFNKNLQIDFYRKLVDGISENKNIFLENVAHNLETISYDELEEKNLIFGEEQHHTSQFLGIKNYGPHKTLSNNHKFYFLYEQKAKNAAHQLFYALTGKYQQFSGLEKFFKLRMKKGQDYDGILIENYNDSLTNAVAKIVSEDIEHKIAILIINKENEDYHRIKKLFLDQNIPMQVVLLNTVQNDNKLRWIASNIALQCFAKMGGVPWIVNSQKSERLIIGVGQSYDKDEDGTITKYYGYSVMTDASGVYKEVRFLHSDNEKDGYLNGLLEKIKEIIKEKEDDYKQFILHVTFKMKKKEINKIKNTLSEMTNVIVIKINSKSEIKLFSESNSKIYNHGSYIKVSSKKYILCTDGVSKENEPMNRKISWPLDIEFIYPEKLDNESIRSCIEDIYNLSNANWRGFNSNKLPVSLLYAQLISKYLKGMKNICAQGEIPKIDSSVPWFL